MAVTIKSPREIELMRKAGEILAQVHEELHAAVHPGMSTLDIDKLGERLIRSHGCIPSFKNYNGYPASICVSVNDEIVHGIPNKHRILKDGDIVSLDAGTIYKGYHSDAARTWAVGNVSPEAQKLMDVTKQCFYEGIKFAKAGNHLNDISTAIQAYAEKFGYGVVRELVGHGIGTPGANDDGTPFGLWKYFPGSRGPLKNTCSCAVQHFRQRRNRSGKNDLFECTLRVYPAR